MATSQATTIKLMALGLPPPLDEACRMATLHACRMLDTEREHGFDEIASLAAQLAETPMAIVSLVDETRQWFKAAVGLSMSETACAYAFCSRALLGTAPLTIEDARRDTRFADNPVVVGAPGIRFFHGIPLEMADGERLGTLCVLDTAPRALSPSQNRALGMLSRQIVAQLELRRALGDLAHLRERERRRDDSQLAAQILSDHELGIRLHEGLFQELAGLVYKLSALTVQAQHLTSPLAHSLDQLSKEFRQSLGACRLIAQDHRGYLLLQNGWREALRLRVAHLNLPNEIGCTIHVAGDPGPRLGLIAAFRTIELIAGAVQRAEQRGAKQIEVWIDGGADACSIIIETNGETFLADAARGNGHFNDDALTELHQLAANLHAVLTHKVTGEGLSQLSCSIPLADHSLESRKSAERR